MRAPSLRRMSLRNRLSLVAAAAVAITAIVVSLVTYLVARHELYDQVDDGLRQRAELIERLPNDRRLPLGGALVPALLGTSFQLVLRDGRVIDDPRQELELPVGETEREILAGARGPTFSDVDVEGVHLRVLAVPVRDGLLQLARPLDDVDEALRRLRRILVLVTLGSVALAALLGRVVARASLVPVERLSETVEEVGRTGDLSRRIEVESDDEIGRLGLRFNEMLGALAGAQASLERSVEEQRQLVADASHELRTPLTSLRTNIEVLARRERLAAEDEHRLIADVTLQLEELTVLVDDVVELARGAEPDAVLDDVRLDELVAAAVDRARLHRPAVRFEMSLTPSVVRGTPARIDRAVTNLLDNAAKWSPEGAVVEVGVADGEVTVRDHGPGIDPADLPHVFDRFYRAAAARSTPGSGLGLAIVKQVAEAHGGHAAASNAEAGGAILVLGLVPESIEATSS